MEQRISLITLGVADLERARAFYQRLGWEGQEVEEKTQGIRVAKRVVEKVHHPFGKQHQKADSECGGQGLGNLSQDIAINDVEHGTMILQTGAIARSITGFCVAYQKCPGQI